jgi:hypothetical protein
MPSPEQKTKRTRWTNKLTFDRERNLAATTHKRPRKKRELAFSQEQELYDLWQEIREDCEITNKTAPLTDIPVEYRNKEKFKHFLALRDKILIKNLPLIKYYTARTQHCADDIHQDAFQQITLYFLEYIPNFNPALGYTLHTYMRFSLLKASTQAFYDAVYCVKPSQKLIALRNKIQGELIVGLSPQQVIEKLDISPTKYQEALKTFYIADTARKHSYPQLSDPTEIENEERLFYALYYKNPLEADFGKILRHLKETYERTNPELFEQIYKFFTSSDRYKRATIKKLEKTIQNEQRKRQISAATPATQSG